jgi:hypothetical protein
VDLSLPGYYANILVLASKKLGSRANSTDARDGRNNGRAQVQWDEDDIEDEMDVDGESDDGGDDDEYEEIERSL